MDEDDMQRLLGKDAVLSPGSQELSQLKDRMSDFYAQSQEIHAEEFEIMGKFYGHVLEEAFGITYAGLDPESQDKLSQMVELALELGCDDASPAGLAIPLSQLDIDLAQCKLEYTKKSALLSKLQRRKLHIASRLTLLEKHVNACMNDDMAVKKKISGWSDNIALLNEKRADYENRISEFQKEISHSRVLEDGLMLDDIKKLEHENEILAEKVASMQSKLDAFQSLPPDIALAKLAVEDKRARLSDLENERKILLSSIADSII